MNIILVIILFGALIFVHELGHFITAKLSGVNVEQFTIGFGPALVKKKVGETLYALRLLPLGGAVMMAGESEEEKILAGSAAQEKADDGRGFCDASPLRRIIISVAGAFMNLVVGILIMIILFLPAKTIYSPIITDFMDGFAFEGDGGFEVGDRIVKINGFDIYIYGDVNTALYLGEGRDFNVTVVRDGKRIKLENLPMERKIPDEDDPSSLKYGFIFGTEDLSPLKRVGFAFSNAASFIQSAYKSLGLMITGKVAPSQMMGTVGVASEMASRAKQSSAELWYFVAFVSINLAVVNLLPVPALDGGRILFILIEVISRRKLNPKYENYISLAGLLLILALFVFVTYNDIVRLLS